MGLGGVPDYEVFGAGCGPANLGVAIALEEEAGSAVASRSLFVDKKPCFDWHPDMLLDSSVMQISFLKDLVTQRNPQSSYTFLSYLKDKGRLSDFINKKTFFPSRREFTDYLSWCCSRLSVNLKFGANVESVSFDPDSRFNKIVWSENGDRHSCTAKYVVFGIGSKPDLPSWATESGNKVIHNNSLLSGARSVLTELGADARVAVVGQGQSAAESIRHILETFPNCVVDAYWSGYGMVPADSSPFANRVFDPEAVDDFYYARPEIGESLIRRHRHTNYSCVDIDLINWLYSFEYEQRVAGERRLQIHRASSVKRAKVNGDKVELTVVDELRDEEVASSVDLCICATGFSSDYPRGLINVDERDILKLERDYRIVLNGKRMPWFVVGLTGAPHGLSSGLLSNISVRSGEIVNSILPDLASTDVSHT